MFRAVLSDAKLWRSVIEALSTLVEQANFMVTPAALKMRAMDPVRVAMVDFELSKDAFEEYQCSSEMKMGINLEEMGKIMRRAGSGDSLELVHDDKSNKLLVRFRGKSTRTFSQSLLDLGSEELPTPRVEFNVTAKLTTEAIGEAIKDAGVVSDQVKIIVKPDMLTMQASGDTGDALIEFRKGSEALLELEVKEESNAIYALNYLNDMMKASSISETASLQFSTNMPLRVDLGISSGGRITYFLAPRREAE
ncbi:MAG: proliferating cell nuclear antigen (pcna) [Promethearchaeati archaeon SRVP18_Atabeyarchaeia-1]